jgi:hypothetical protein
MRRKMPYGALFTEPLKAANALDLKRLYQIAAIGIED